jgi:hypothetical protein
MKKILFLIVFAAAGIISVAMLNVRMNTQNALSPIVSLNLKALASFTRNTVGCYSESEESPRHDYYDCGPCDKVSGRKGIGQRSECSY